MTLLATHDSRVICRIQLTREGRWVSLALSLGDLAPTNRFLIRAERLLYEMAAVDEGAQSHGLSNWQGGVISGARYAFRALKAPIQQVCLHELRGQLGSGDVGAVSAAAALAVARLLDSGHTAPARRPDFPLDLTGWAIEEEIRSPQEAEGIVQGSKVGSVQPEPSEVPGGNGSAASEKSGTNEGTQDLPATPDPVE